MTFLGFDLLCSLLLFTIGLKLPVIEGTGRLVTLSVQLFRLSSRCSRSSEFLRPCMHGAALFFSPHHHHPQVLILCLSPPIFSSVSQQQRRKERRKQNEIVCAVVIRMLVDFISFKVTPFPWQVVYIPVSGLLRGKRSRGTWEHTGSECCIVGLL